MCCTQGFERKSAFDVVMALAALELALGPGVASAQQQRAVGYGGAAALALQRQGWQLQILEQSAQLSEVGAGIQIGPNVTRILHSWGLQEALKVCAAEPERLVARHAWQGHGPVKGGRGAECNRGLWMEPKLGQAAKPA
jgi:hypothetical protein